MKFNNVEIAQLSINCKKLNSGAVQAINNKGDVVAVWCKDNSLKPNYRNKYTIVDCYKYKINWLKD